MLAVSASTVLKLGLFHVGGQLGLHETISQVTVRMVCVCGGGGGGDKPYLALDHIKLSCELDLVQEL